MATYKLKITRNFTSAESALISVEADSLEGAIEAADLAYMEGEYEGRADVEWEEDADAWDATDHEIEEAEV